jgi:two-component system cell cycle sensor histidine kinase PleC
MRNPLGAIVGMAGELAHNEDLSLSDARLIGHVIHESGDKLILLTDQLLLAAQLETGAIVPDRSWVQASEVVSQSLKLIRPLATTKQIELTYGYEGTSDRILLDVEKVSHMLNNLLSNAVKFTDPGGAVSLRCSCDGKTITFCIKDNGIGIPEALIPTLFDQFNADRRRGTRNEKGTGLGLPLVKQLVEMEGGTMQVTSSPGEGTEISIKLPLTSQHS